MLEYRDIYYRVSEAVTTKRMSATEL